MFYETIALQIWCVFSETHCIWGEPTAFIREDGDGLPLIVKYIYAMLLFIKYSLF